MIASKRLQYATNVSTGISAMISGTDSSAPNNGVLRSVNGLAFANSTVRSFNATISISIARSSGGNLFETFTLEGNQRDASWDLVVSSVGDVTNTTFSITSTGQVQHTTAVVSNWTSTTIRFSAVQINVTGSLTGLSTTTTGSYIVSSLQLSDTTDAVSGVSNGGLQVLGGATVTKNLNAGSASAANMAVGTLTASNLVTTNVSGTTVTASNLAVGTLTAGNLRVPGTLTVTNITVNNLIQSSGSIVSTDITTGTINITNSISRYGLRTLNNFVTLYKYSGQNVNSSDSFGFFTITFDRISSGVSSDNFTSDTNLTQLTTNMGLTLSGGTIFNYNSYTMYLLVNCIVEMTGSYQIRLYNDVGGYEYTPYVTINGGFYHVTRIIRLNSNHSFRLLCKTLAATNTVVTTTTMQIQLL